MPKRSFAELLTAGPAFLFLGQSYLSLESGVDPFFQTVAKKFGGDPSERNYSFLFGSDAATTAESTLAWMQDKCSILQSPSWLKTVAAFPWSGVYSSAIDIIWIKAFENEWRELYPIFSEEINPLDPRNRIRLHCTYLYGAVDRNTAEAQPPLSKLSFLRRKQIAIQLARRLPGQITPTGVLAIEGYDPTNDWLRSDDLAPIIDSLNVGQAHIFSATALHDDEYIRELSQSGKVQLHDKSLSATLLEAKEQGHIELGKRPDFETHARQVKIGGKVSQVPRNIWNQVARSAVILDTGLACPPKAMSLSRRYREFKHFLADSGTQPVWSGYLAGFAFARDFEQTLRAKVMGRLSKRELSDEPIILEGQTGTGKTIALGALAFGCSQHGHFPALFIPRRTQRPVASDINSFCKWAEDCGAQSILIVWDGMVKVEQYSDFLMMLSGLGRKVVLVGSCYEIGEKSVTPDSLVRVDNHMSAKESKAFSVFLNSIEENLGDYIFDRFSSDDKSFLVALYRLLPETRARIRSGIVTEVGLVEDDLLRRIRNSSVRSELDTTLGHALVSAGIITSTDLISEEDREFAGESLSGAERLTALVMVPGRFGLRTPLDLLLRALGTSGYKDLMGMMLDMPIFSWDEDAVGNVLVSPRHALEAELLVQARYNSPSFETKVAQSLIGELQSTQDRPEDLEVQFINDLLVAMGPDSRLAMRYAKYWIELSESLRSLREDKGISIHRLVMREANLLREFVRWHSQTGQPPEDSIELLDQAIEILSDSMERLESSNRKHRNAIYSELAAIHGTKLVHILRNMQDDPAARYALDELHTCFASAWSLDTENYYPFDILSWSTEALLRSDMDDSTKQKSAAEILHYLSVAEDLNLSPEAQHRLDQRRFTLGRLLGNVEFSDSAFQRLVDAGETVAYYLKAREIQGNIPHQQSLTEEERRRCGLAFDFLQRHESEIASDPRSLYLMLSSWWRNKIGHKFFFGERSTTPFDDQDWPILLQLLKNVMTTQEFHDNLQLRFLEGLSLFHENEIEGSFSVFRDLQRDSRDMRGRRRIVRSYLASKADGTPSVYSGEVVWVNVERNRGELYVPNLRRNVLFLPREFNRPEIESGEPITEFHIAFNFLGIIADPVEFYRYTG